MAYSVLALKDLAELKTRRGTSANNTAATIMGPNFPTTEAYTVYAWDDTSTLTNDDDNVVAPTVGPTNGRWLKVSLDTSAVNLSVFYTKLDLSTPSSGANVDWTNLTNKPTTAAGFGITDSVSTSGSYTNPTWIASLPSSKITGLATVATSGSYADLSNKPTIPTAQIQSDWNQTTTSALDYIKNKPIIPAAQVQTDWNASTGLGVLLNKPTLSTVATSGSYVDLSNKPTIPAAQVQTDWNASTGLGVLLNKPTLSTVASTGSYTDLTNKPTLSTVATSGSYADLSNKPTIPAAQIQSDWNQTTTTSSDYIKNKPNITKTQNTSTRSLNTSFQPSTTQDTLGIYSVNITVTFSLSGAQTGTVFLEISPDNSTWTQVTSSQLTWQGTLVVGLSLGIVNSQTLTAFIPKNYYARLRTTGTGTLAYQSGQEIYL